MLSPCSGAHLSHSHKRAQVRGEVHHDRRLHQLMLQEELREWARGPAAKQWPSTTDDEDSDATDDALLLTASSSLALAASSPADSVSSLHADLMDPSDSAFQFRYTSASAALELMLSAMTCPRPGGMVSSGGEKALSSALQGFDSLAAPASMV